MNESPFKGKTGLTRLRNAFFYSMAGLAAAYRNEDAFRQELRLAALLIPLALWLPASGTGKALMIASVLLVILVELVNSAVEAAVVRRVILQGRPLTRIRMNDDEEKELTPRPCSCACLQLRLPRAQQLAAGHGGAGQVSREVSLQNAQPRDPNSVFRRQTGL